MMDRILYHLNLNLSMHFRVRFMSIVGKGFLTRYFMKALPYNAYLPPSFFKFCLTSFLLQPPPQLLFCYLVSLAEWVIASHFNVLFYLILWYDIMIKALHISSLGTIVAEEPCCVFYAIRCQVYY